MTASCREDKNGLGWLFPGSEGGAAVRSSVSLAYLTNRIVTDDRRVGRVWEWPLEVFSSEMDVGLFLSPPSPPQSLGSSRP